VFLMMTCCVTILLAPSVAALWMDNRREKFKNGAYDGPLDLNSGLTKVESANDGLSSACSAFS
jgi:hypothetical protein